MICWPFNNQGYLMDLSYTQNLEDYHLSLAFADRASGTYIDVGAGHPNRRQCFLLVL